MTGAGALILVAGPPGTGKSHLCRRIQERFAGCVNISIDPIKEALWDAHGFDGPQDKRRLDRLALARYFEAVEAAMADGALIVSDYPFSGKQERRLRALCEEHGCTPITIRLLADPAVLYERQRRRDLDPSRHPGHLLDRYRPGRALPDRGGASGLLTREEFMRRCTTRGYGAFSLGRLLEVDTTDFDAVDHAAVLDWIAARIPQRRAEPASP